MGSGYIYKGMQGRHIQSLPALEMSKFPDQERIVYSDVLEGIQYVVLRQDSCMDGWFGII